MTAERQITKNCHFISRFLTRPWEGPQRHLRYYDFDADAFGEAPSLRLFAEDEINSQAVEDWLNHVLETPLATVRPRLAAGDPRTLDDPPFFRAAVLMLWLQGVRGKAVAEQKSRRDLDVLAALPEEQLDALVTLLTKEYDLRLVFTVGEQGFPPLLVPSTGIFPFLFRHEAYLHPYAFGFALPLDLRCTLIATPVVPTKQVDLYPAPESLGIFSIGTAAARRVVLPPGMPGTDDDLRRDLKERRESVGGLLAQGQRVTDAVLAAFQQAGIRPPTDRTGRVLK